MKKRPDQIVFLKRVAFFNAIYRVGDYFHSVIIVGWLSGVRRISTNGADIDHAVAELDKGTAVHGPEI